MISFFKNLNALFKINLCLLSTIVLFQSCNNHKSFGNRTDVNPSNSNKGFTTNSGESMPTLPPRFLDTLKLGEMGISYQKVASDKSMDQWLLKLKDTIPKSNQIQELTFKFLVNLVDENSPVIFQLDSLIVQLPNKIQTFGFNEFGTYFHSYEFLLKQDILFEDYNFDGLIDFSIQSGRSGVTNEVRDYYIYNPRSKRFNNSIVMANATFDKSKKLVYQSWHNSADTGGKSTYRYSKVDTLIMIKSVNKEYINRLASYVNEVKLLQSDGTYSITLDTIKRK